MAKEDDAGVTVVDPSDPDFLEKYAAQQLARLREHEGPVLRHVYTVSADEDFSGIAGWLMHMRMGNPFQRSHAHYVADLEMAVAKPQAVIAADYADGMRYWALLDVYESRTGCNLFNNQPTLGTGKNWGAHVVLEPLSEDEVRKTESSAVDGVTVILSPADFRAVLAR